MQLSNPQYTGSSTSRREETDSGSCKNREIVTLDTTNLLESNTEDAEIVVLDATDILDQESDESDGGWMCALCKAIFATKEQWDDHYDYGTCLAPNTPNDDKKYCHTCRTVFNSKEGNDRQRVLHICEHSSKTTMLSCLLACLLLKLINNHRPPMFTYPDCPLI